MARKISAETRLETTSDEAARWIAIIDRGLRAEEGPLLRSWLDDKTHRNVIQELAKSASPEVKGLLSELCPDHPDLLAVAPPGPNYFGIAMKAVLALTIVVLGTFALMGTMPWLYFGNARLTNVPKDTSTTYKTTTGVIREVKLPDNSLVKLNTRSQITVTYALHARNVNLDYGEASFDVVHDPDRPFNVRAGKREFQALGTRFIVRVIDPDNVELTVTEGEVKVVYAPPRLPQTPEEKRENLTFGEQTLTALQTARVQPGYQSVRELVTGEKEAREAWLDGKIIFDRTPLADALAEVDRYTNIEFIVADEKLRSVPVAGDFRAGDIDGLLEALRKNFRIDSRRDAHGRVVLTTLTAAGS